MDVHDNVVICHFGSALSEAVLNTRTPLLQWCGKRPTYPIPGSRWRSDPERAELRSRRATDYRDGRVNEDR